MGIFSFLLFCGRIPVPGFIISHLIPMSPPPPPPPPEKGGECTHCEGGGREGGREGGRRKRKQTAETPKNGLGLVLVLDIEILRK